ncbi:11739_t:CDS:2 [Ambispora leptoticha]|uniref:11739_t:CDS:1 n=1 Tax=Ambispora leptoticha TaxID=144679 RepID=A0A9N9BYD9_9GLOM|nr:11739_t:CDS:2 [Ambispora leptoticha]
MNQDYNIDDLLKHEKFPALESLYDKPGCEIEIIEIVTTCLQPISYIILYAPQEKFSLWRVISNKQEAMSIQAMGYHLTIYPYGEEIPALLEKFYNKNVASDNLDDEYYIHPLMSSCHMLSSFFHIHSFYDGNGRIGRSLMALYLSHAGYPPPVFQQLNRKKLDAKFLPFEVKAVIAMVKKGKKDIMDIDSEHNIFKVGRTTRLTKKRNSIMDSIKIQSEKIFPSCGDYALGSPINVVLNASPSPETPSLEPYLKQD